MKLSFLPHLGLLAALAQLSACQEAELKVSLCEGKPAFDLAPFAGSYTKGTSQIYEGGKLVKEEITEVNSSEGTKPLVLSVENGNQLGAGSPENPAKKGEGLSHFRACKIGSQIWVEDALSVGGANYGFLVMAYDKNSFSVKVESIDEALVKKLGVPYTVDTGTFLGHHLLINNTGVSAEKMLGILGENNYSIQKFER